MGREHCDVDPTASVRSQAETSWHGRCCGASPRRRLRQGSNPCRVLTQAACEAHLGQEEVLQREVAAGNCGQNDRAATSARRASAGFSRLRMQGYSPL